MTLSTYTKLAVLLATAAAVLVRPRPMGLCASAMRLFVGVHQALISVDLPSCHEQATEPVPSLRGGRVLQETYNTFNAPRVNGLRVDWCYA